MALSGCSTLPEVQVRIDDSCSADSGADPFSLLTVHGRPLDAYAAARQAADRNEPGADQVATQISAIMGVDPPTDLNVLHSECRTSLPDPVVPALPGLFERIKQRNPRFVILNESHVSQRDRAFASQLVAGLQQKGFSVLAVEGIFPNSDVVGPDGFVNSGAGFYTNDPIFSEMLGNAVRRGMHVYPYDAAPRPGAPFQEREQAQAANLAAIARRHPDAGIIVLAGGSHGSTLPAEDGRARMGFWLQQQGVGEVFSINQTNAHVADSTLISARSCWGLDETPENPVLLPESAKADDGFDAYIAHPSGQFRARTGDLTGRVPVQTKLSSTAVRPLLVRAFPEDADPNHSVPFDQFLVTDQGATHAQLFLRPGRYRVVEELVGCIRRTHAHKLIVK